MSNRTISKIATILLPVAAIILYLIKDSILALVPFLPSCYFNSLFHLYCPSCGNTRSVTALLQGDLLKSLRFNIVPILMFLLLLLAYIEIAAYSFGKKIKVVPRKLSFYLVLIALLVFYWVIRNFIPYLTP